METPDHSQSPLVLRVVGDPAPKGSSRAMLIAGRARNVPSGSNANRAKLGGWKTAVADCYGAVDDRKAITVGAVAVGIVFRLPLRGGAVDKVGGPKASATVAVIVKPDVDKLVRSTLDALTFAGAWRDDSQIPLLMAAKCYVPPGVSLGADLVIGGFDPLDFGADALRVVDLWRYELGVTVGMMATAKNDAHEARRAAASAKRLNRVTKNGRRPLLPHVPPFPPTAGEPLLDATPPGSFDLTDADDVGDWGVP